MRTKQNGLLTLLLAFIVQITFAQEKTITGTVVDQEGLPLPGVNVVIVGTTRGTQTDFDGRYSISSQAGETLLFTYLGQADVRQIITSQSFIDVSMTADASVLDEVIVVAYGTANKLTYTGAVATVESPEIAISPVTTFTNALQGNVSGLRVNSLSGDPGSGSDIRIRGIGSINANTSPLYVIDGIATLGGNVSQLADDDNPSDLAGTDVLSTINPNDIESITVLKDAAAASIYGARAANGVVVITTKSGKNGVTRINFDSKVSFSSLPNRGYSLMSSKDYYKTYFDAYVADGFTADEANAAITNALSGNNPYNTLNPLDINGNLASGASIVADTDWVDEIYRNAALAKEYNLSASGGNDKGSFFMSVGYLNQEGIIKGSDFERVSVRSNLKKQLSDAVEIGMNTSLSYTDQNRGAGDTAGSAATRNALLFANAIPVYEQNLDGSYVLDDNGDKQYNFSNPVSIDFNPLYTVDNDIYNTKTYRVLSNIYAEIGLDFITDGLAFRTDESVDFYTVDDFQFYNPFHGNAAGDTSGRGYSYATWNTLWSTSNKILYNKTFSNHTFDALIGYETSENRDRINQAHATRYATYGSVVLSELANAALPEGASSQTDKWSIFSYISRLNYDYLNKYIFSASFRRDGSSRFGSNNKFGNFYSLSGGWVISSENFLEDTSWIDNLKLRFSYGTSGNDQVGLYDYQTNYTSWNYDGNIGNGLFELGNSNLSWEESTTKDAGLDFIFFNGRLSGNLDYYERKTSGLLYDIPASRSSGVEGLLSNAADMKNTGIEISVDFNVIQNKNFTWNVATNYTSERNEIIDLGGAEEEINGTKIRKPGGSIYDFYLRKWAGVNPDTGAPQWETQGEDGEPNGVTSNFAEADRFDGVGSSLPDGYGGLRNTFSYKGLSLNVNTYFSIGGKILDNVESDLLSDGENFGFQLSNKQLSSWKNVGDITDVPVFTPQNTTSSNDATSTRYLYDATYAKVKSITLSYNLQPEVVKKIGLKSLSFYVSGTNLFIWMKDKDFDGFDPEVGLNGLTSYTTPNPRSIVTGFKIGL